MSSPPTDDPTRQLKIRDALKEKLRLEALQTAQLFQPRPMDEEKHDLRKQVLPTSPTELGAMNSSDDGHPDDLHCRSPSL